MNHSLEYWKERCALAEDALDISLAINPSESYMRWRNFAFPRDNEPSKTCTCKHPEAESIPEVSLSSFCKKCGLQIPANYPTISFLVK